MDTWQGEYGWQTYARTGRPDLLNYVRIGDLTWPDLWRFFSERGLPEPDAFARCMRLFHQFQSWQFDVEGGIPDPDGEVIRDLLSWADFCVEHQETVPDTALRDQLVTLVEAGGISSSYFECAFQCYIQALVARHSRTWPVPIPDDLSVEIQPCVGYGKLSVFVPEDDPGLPAAKDPEWQRFKRLLAQKTHDSWCPTYASLIDRLGDMGDERPGL